MIRWTAKLSIFSSSDSFRRARLRAIALPPLFDLGQECIVKGGSATDPFLTRNSGQTRPAGLRLC